MTNSPTTHTTRLDQCPPGLIRVAAHGDIPGRLAWIDDPGKHVWGITGPMWSLRGDELAQHEGIPLTPIPTETAAASTDPRVRAYVKEQR